MGNIRKLKSGSYQYRKQIDGEQFCITFDHKPSDREIQLAVAKEITEQGERVPKNAFVNCCRDYIEVKRPVLSPSTIKGYQSQINMMSDEFKKIDINDITQVDIQREIGEHAKTHAGKSTSNFHGFISAVLAMYRPSMQLNTTLPQKVKYEGYTPTQEEVRAILNEVKDTEFEIPFQLGALGLRRSEVCALDLDDLSDDNTIFISKSRVKTDKNAWYIKPMTKTEQGRRHIYVPDVLADKIREKGYVYNGDPSNLLKKLHKVQDKLGIPRFRLHDMRAFYASFLHSKGVSDATIMELGGWQSDYVMKKVYRRAMEADKKKSLDVISEIF